MTTILRLDLGKFKSVACLYDPNTLEARYSTIPTDPDTIRRFLDRDRPGLVVFETCTIAGWVADLFGTAALVAVKVVGCGSSLTGCAACGSTASLPTPRGVRLHSRETIPRPALLR